MTEPQSRASTSINDPSAVSESLLNSQNNPQVSVPKELETCIEEEETKEIEPQIPLAKAQLLQPKKIVQEQA